MAAEQMPDPRTGWKRVGDHRDGCCCAGKPDPFVITADDRSWTFALDRIGRKGGSTMWWVFRCNDISCPAQMLVRWDVLSTFVSNPPRKRAADAEG